jgi:hypothetical protein
MKTLLVIVIVGLGAWFAWKRVAGPSTPLVIENPVYAEIRATANVANRDLEMVLFVRSSSDFDCRTRSRVSWEGALQGCPTCKLQEPKCQDKLPPRYARLFDDVPIPSAYLSATAGTGGERDGRLVVYGLTDAEGAMMCEAMRKQIAEKYHGTLRCVAASGA